MFCHLSGAENAGVNPHNTAAMVGEDAWRGCSRLCLLARRGENTLTEESLRTTVMKSPATACSLGFQAVFAARGALPAEFLSN